MAKLACSLRKLTSQLQNILPDSGFRFICLDVSLYLEVSVGAQSSTVLGHCMLLFCKNHKQTAFLLTQAAGYNITREPIRGRVPGYFFFSPRVHVMQKDPTWRT